MSSKVVAIAVLSVAVAAGIAIYAYNRGGGKAEQDAMGTATRPLADYTAAGRELQRAAAEKPATLPKEVPVGSIISEDTRNVALSEDERAWLSRHHYLSKQDLDATKNIPDATLQEARTDARAQTILGMRLLERGEIIPAATVLTNAASHGSVYAYEEAAVALLKQQVENNNGRVDPIYANMFRARMEVAKIMGDHRADALFAQYFPNYDSRSNAQTVQLQTTEYLRQLGSNAQAQGTRAAGPDPRPNADLWDNLQKLNEAGGSTDLATVYPP